MCKDIFFVEDIIVLSLTTVFVGVTLVEWVQTIGAMELSEYFERFGMSVVSGFVDFGPVGWKVVNGIFFFSRA